MNLTNDQLWKIVRQYDTRLPSITHSEGLTVEHATSNNHLVHIIELDSNPKGFLKPNQYGKKGLTNLWNRDKLGFYVIYDSMHKPIGYFDLFGLDPKWKFIKSQLIEQRKGKLDLPKTDDLCDVIVPREEWSDRVIEIYVDAILLLKPYRGTQAAWHLVNHACKDLQSYCNVRISRIATVAVDNEREPSFSPEVADNPYKNLCNGAKFAIRAGLLWGKYKGEGHEGEMGLGRYLYVSEFGLIPPVRIWALCSASPVFKFMARQWLSVVLRIPQIHEFIRDHLQQLPS